MLRGLVTIILIFYFFALTTPAAAVTCAEVQSYIDAIGEDAVRAAARARNVTERQIGAFRRRCAQQAARTARPKRR